MDIATLYWLLVILWIISLFGSWWGPEPYRVYTARGSSIFVLVLFFLIGLKVMGPMLH